MARRPGLGDAGRGMGAALILPPRRRAALMGRRSLIGGPLPVGAGPPRGFRLLGAAVTSRWPVRRSGVLRGRIARSLIRGARGPGRRLGGPSTVGERPRPGALRRPMPATRLLVRHGRLRMARCVRRCPGRRPGPGIGISSGVTPPGTGFSRMGVGPGRPLVIAEPLLIAPRGRAGLRTGLAVAPSRRIVSGERNGLPGGGAVIAVMARRRIAAAGLRARPRQRLRGRRSRRILVRAPAMGVLGGSLGPRAGRRHGLDLRPAPVIAGRVVVTAGRRGCRCPAGIGIS